MKNDVLVSVIIPLYNAEKTALLAIESIVQQTYKSIELIIVDDGSTDNTSSMLSHYFEEHSFPHQIIRQGNSGVAAARNSGIKNASGQYVVFLDADDYLDADIIEQAISSVQNERLLYQWGMVQIFPDGSKQDTLIEDRGYTTYDLLANCIYLLTPEIGLYFRACWGKLLNLNIIKEQNILFPEDLYIGEDAVFMLQYLKNVEGYKLVSTHGQNYAVSFSSATHRYKKDLLEQSSKQLVYIKKFIAENNLAENKRIQEAYTNLLWWLYEGIVNNSIGGLKNKEIAPALFFDDICMWYQRYEAEMKRQRVSVDSVDKNYRIFYRNADNLSYSMLCLLTLLQKIERKIKR